MLLQIIAVQVNLLFLEQNIETGSMWQTQLENLEVQISETSILHPELTEWDELLHIS